MTAERETRQTKSGKVTLTHRGYMLRNPERGVADLYSYITNDDTLFIVTHMGLAEIDVGSWRLFVEGLVERPKQFSLAEILAFPQHEVVSVHECAGSPLTPEEPKRRVGNVIWRGARLCDVLESCGIRHGASFVWSEGLEWGEFAGVKNEAFVKDLPIAKAKSLETLLAVSMNGSPLTSQRGGPVRLVVPGWYGTNSVKWLGRLRLEGCRAPGPFTTTFYNDLTPAGKKPVWEIAPECVIVSPSGREKVRATEEFRVSGWAWAELDIAHVEVSIDGGFTWVECVVEERKGCAWQSFSLITRLSPGRHKLLCRCFDTRGVGQPEEVGRNAVHSIEVDAL